MQHQSAGLTHAGRVRRQNQDTILMAWELGLYILCDGCGGRAAGEVASKMACEITHQVIREKYRLLEDYAGKPSLLRRRKAIDLITSAINVASEQMYAAGRSDLSKSGMGSTIVALVIVASRAIIAHAGDSRLYLLRDSQIHRLTEDHNMADQYVKMGLMTSEQGRKSPYAAMITRAVGFHEHAQLDTLHFELAPGDMLLLCSDGLSMYLTENELTRICRNTALDQVPEELIRLANHRGGADNSSAIIVRVDPEASEGDRDVVRCLQTLRRVPLFQHLSFKELLGLMDLVEIESYETGRRILAEGQTSDRFFVSISGSMEVVKSGQVLAQLPAGSLLGEMGLIDRRGRSADIIAKEPARVMMIPRAEFFSLLKRDRTLAVKVLWGLCHVLNSRLRHTSEELSGVKVNLDQLTGPDRPFV